MLKKIIPALLLGSILIGTAAAAANLASPHRSELYLIVVTADHKGQHWFRVFYSIESDPKVVAKAAEAGRVGEFPSSKGYTAQREITIHVDQSLFAAAIAGKNT